MAGGKPESGIAATASIPLKRHLIITGGRGSGKSTLLRELLALPHFRTPGISISTDAWNPASGSFVQGSAHVVGEFPGFTTQAFPCDCVELTDNLTGETARIGSYHPLRPFTVQSSSEDNFSQNICIKDCTDSGDKPSITELSRGQRSGNQMTPDVDGFLGLGLTSITRAITSPCKWAVIDELGYLESSCLEFCDAVFRLFDKKQVIAVLRSQSTPFLDALRARDDVFVYDLEHPVLPVGCVIMASGLGKRFGSNKLMADFNGKLLISRILSATGGGLFAARIVVTRSMEVEAFCREREIPVLLHTMPYRNHTVRLGLSTLLKGHPELAGCMFALGDQPLLRRETLEAMTITFSQYCRRGSGALRGCSASSAFGSSDIKANDDTKSMVSPETGRVRFSPIFRLADISKSNSLVPGNPILFGNQYFEELLTLPDHYGGNVLLEKFPDAVRYFPAADSLELSDADTPAELEKLEKAELIR